MFYLPENNSLGIRYLIDARGSIGLGGTAGGGGVSTGGSVTAMDLNAFDPATGNPIWHSRIGTVSNAPETYTLDGRQHVLVAVGDMLAAYPIHGAR